MTGKVYAVASGKGGVGKTTTVVNLGVTIRADEHSVALVDADLGMANLGTFLGIDHEPTLHDVLAGEASIDDALVEQVDGFGILPGARDLRQYAAADPRSLKPVLEELSDRFEYVLVDTGAGVGFEDVLPLELVDEVLLVASPDRAALGDAGKTAEVSELLGVTVRGVVFTMADESDDVSAIADKMGVEHLATVPEDPSVPESTASGRPLEAFAPDSAAARGYRELAAALTGRDVAQYEPDEASEEPCATNDTTSESSEERSPKTVDGAAAESDATPDTPAESSEAADTTDENLEASEPTLDETGGTDGIDGAAAEGASDTADDEESITESTEDDGESDAEGAEIEARNEPRVGSDDGSTDGDNPPADDDEQVDTDSPSDGDVEAPPNTESTSPDTEEEASGEASAEDEHEWEESEAKSGGLLSRLGGLFG